MLVHTPSDDEIGFFKQFHQDGVSCGSLSLLQTLAPKMTVIRGFSVVFFKSFAFQNDDLKSMLTLAKLTAFLKNENAIQDDVWSIETMIEKKQLRFLVICNDAKEIIAATAFLSTYKGYYCLAIVWCCATEMNCVSQLGFFCRFRCFQG